MSRVINEERRGPGGGKKSTLYIKSAAALKYAKAKQPWGTKLRIDSKPWKKQLN